MKSPGGGLAMRSTSHAHLSGAAPPYHNPPPTSGTSGPSPQIPVLRTRGQLQFLNRMMLISVVVFGLFIWIAMVALRVETRSSSSSSSSVGRRRDVPRTANNNRDNRDNQLFGEGGDDHQQRARSGAQPVSDEKLAALLRDGGSSVATTSLYCDPNVHRNQNDMRELAHRAFSIPLDEMGPAVIQPVIVEEHIHQSFQKSLDQLVRERVHDWHFVLEGAQTTPEGHSMPSLLEPPFTNLEGGFYCLSVRDEVDNCIVASVPFTVVDRKREDSEYAVAPVRLSSRTTLYGTIAKAAQAAAAAKNEAPDDNAALMRNSDEQRKRSSIFRLKDVVFMYSKYFPLRSVCPVVVYLPTVLESFYQQNDFSSHHDEFLHHSVTVAQRHVSISAGTTGGGASTHMDVEYGKGSFWLVPGESYSLLRSSLAKKDRRFLDALRLQKQSAEAVKRAAFEHYASQRSILLSPNPDEDEPIANSVENNINGAQRGGEDKNRPQREDMDLGAIGNVMAANRQRRKKKQHEMEKDLLAIARQLMELPPDRAATDPSPLNDFADANLEERLHDDTQHDNNRNDELRRKQKARRRNKMDPLLEREGGGDAHRGEKKRSRRRDEEESLQERTGHHKPHHHHTTHQLVNYTVPLLTDTLNVHGVPHEMMYAPQNLNALLSYIHNLDKDQPCTVRISWTVRIRERVRIERACLLVFENDRAQLVLESGADVVLAGSGPLEPTLLTSVDAASFWGGIVVESGAALVLRHTIVHFVGSTNVKRVPGTGSHIKRYAPAITLSPTTTSPPLGSSASSPVTMPPATLLIEDSAILNCEGSGFALGKGSRSEILRTLVQDVAQGGECVSCRVNISHSHFIDFPFTANLSLAFVDGDNDAFYFRGGQARVEHTVFLNALDDGIDSASTTGDGEHSTLTLHHVAIENCQHEGLALSGSKGTQRTVTVENSLITATQQGIENGHTPVKHRALIRNTVLYRNHIALRNGDNYPTLDVFGKVRAEHCLFVYNTIPVLDWVQIDHAKRTNRNTYYDPKKYQYEVHNPLLESRDAADAMTPLLTLADCLIDQMSPSHADGVWAFDGADGEMSAAASVGVPHAPVIDERFYKSGLIVPVPPAQDANKHLVGQANRREIRHAATRRYSSADLAKGLFCGRAHFLVEGTITTNQDTWRR